MVGWLVCKRLLEMRVQDIVVRRQRGGVEPSECLARERCDSFTYSGCGYQEALGQLTMKVSSCRRI